MSGFDQWLPGLGAMTGAFALPVWASGALAALFFVVGVLAFARAGQNGRAGTLWRAALVMVGAAVMWIALDRAGGRDQAAARRVLEARATELTLRALAPGSPLACLETLLNATIEAACEKALFAGPAAVAAAVAYIDARLTLLSDSLELAARDRNYESSLERLRSAIETDRFGFVAHVLATRGCRTEVCPALGLLRDPRRVVANLKERTFDANVVLHAAAWQNAPPVASAPIPGQPVAAAQSATPNAVATTGTGIGEPVSGKYEFPSSASIPAISIMNDEPPSAPATEPSAAQPTAPSARPAAPRRQSTREPTSGAPAPGNPLSLR